MGKRIVFCCIPASGHTNPTLNVVRELTQRGHQVWYYSFEPFREVITQAGAEFCSSERGEKGPLLTAEEAAHVGGDMVLGVRTVVEAALSMEDFFYKEVAELQPDCIVGDSMAIWGREAARRLNIPFVSSVTTFAFNQASKDVMRPKLGDLFRILRDMPKMNREIRRLQQAGYPISSPMELVANDMELEAVMYTSPRFQPRSETFPASYHFVGPSVRAAGERVEKTGEKLVYLSLGTVDNHRTAFYQSCIEAFRDCPWQIILSVGEQAAAELKMELPEHITVAGRVDQIAVLQEADVFVTHCGMNSASEALWFGVPLVAVPNTREQEGVANRVLELGAGLRPQDRTGADIRQAVEQVLADPAFRDRAGALRRDFRSCPGAAGAAEVILRAAGEK